MGVHCIFVLDNRPVVYHCVGLFEVEEVFLVVLSLDDTDRGILNAHLAFGDVLDC